MPKIPDEDLLAMMEDLDSAIYTQTGHPHPSSKSLTIYGYFKRGYITHNGIESYAPIFIARDVDIPNVAHDDRLTIDSIIYKVVGIQPDGTGKTFLILETV